MKAFYLKILLLGCSVFPLFAGAQTKHPNIIFILVDDQGYGDLGAFYQNQRAQAHLRSMPFERSPYLDRLAAEGAMLTQHYSAAPVCAPSRASILLGVNQGHANVRDNQFDKALEDNYTMASTLHTLGYSTAAVGKWGLQGLKAKEPDWPAHPLKRGFDYFFGYIRHSDGHEHYPKEGLYDGPKEVWDGYVNVAGNLDKCYTADLWTAAAKKYITGHMTGRDASKPFFLYLAYETPHAVLELPTQAYPAGSGLHGGMQWLGTPGRMISTADGKPDSWVHPDYDTATYDDDSDPATPEVPWPDTYKRYATANRRIDDGVGDLMQLLRDLKIDSNTLVVYTSDNGPSIESYLPKGHVPNEPTFFGSYGPFDGIKRDNWEGGIRMPAIAHWPGHIHDGTVITDPSISYDWAATFLAAAGMPAPVRMDGVSLLPSLTGSGHQTPSRIYIEYFFPGKTPDFPAFGPHHRGRVRNQMQTFRIGDYVGVRYDIKSPDDDFEIYNVVEDPGERHNLAVTHEDLQRSMKAEALRQRRPDAEAPRPYDSALVPAVKDMPVLAHGVRWEAFSGIFPWIPQLETLHAKSRGVSNDLASLPGKKQLPDGGILYLKGYIRVPEDGSYTFFIQTITKTFLRIHDVAVIDGDYQYTAANERSGTIRLQAGLHPFRLYYYPGVKSKDRKAGWPVLEWSGPEIHRQKVPPQVLFLPPHS